jgi:hypothetical protein
MSREKRVSQPLIGKKFLRVFFDVTPPRPAIVINFYPNFRKNGADVLEGWI